MTYPRRVSRCAAPFAAAVLLMCAGTAHANGPEDNVTGGTDNGNHNVSASARNSTIVVRQVKGPTSGNRGNLAPVNANWKPPACWYEPVFTPEGLRDFVEKTGGKGAVGIHEWWYGKRLWTDHYKDAEDETNFDDDMSTAAGYKNYNIGKGGYFWRGVAPDPDDPESWDCGRIMFWQPAHQIPKIPHAPTPKMLAEYAYNQVQVPDTRIELKPDGKSTVNLPTWIWLDKGTFRDVVVRAELPRTGLWAETTAKPVSLHLKPGGDAETYPASGTCSFNDDGSIGTPYKKGDADTTPPCGIRYLRPTSGTPYHLTASVTWQITWQGSDNDGTHDLPDGTFETTQDITVQEIQAVNR